MKKINIAIIGTIGVGKSTLLNRLAATFNTKAVEVRQETSVSVPYISDLLPIIFYLLLRRYDVASSSIPSFM